MLFWTAHFIIIIIIKGIYIAQVRKGHKCAMSAEMAVWLAYVTLHVSITIYITNIIKTVKQKCLQLSSESLLRDVT